MNADERQALRKKHHVGNNEGDDQCQSCYSADGYPCDVIKVLDAYESLIEYHNHDGNTDREDPWCRTCWEEYPCKKGKALGHPDGAVV